MKNFLPAVRDEPIEIANELLKAHCPEAQAMRVAIVVHYFL
ncbi:MAG TPA: hypothetical protein VLX30_10930 [Burkholderiales bacterium]|nr:hypothetical protein [Burkholderiales bacterium]